MKYLYFMRDAILSRVYVNEKIMSLNSCGGYQPEIYPVLLVYSHYVAFKGYWGIPLKKGQQVRIPINKLLEIVEEVK